MFWVSIDLYLDLKVELNLQFKKIIVSFEGSKSKTYFL